MTKNTGGKNFRKAKHHTGVSRREIIFKEFGQEYAVITKMLGDGRCECRCFDDVVRLGNIRGKMRRRVWLNVGDTVLCGLREYQDEKVDIIHKYTEDEVHNLKMMGEIPSDNKENQDNHEEDEVIGEESGIGIDIETI